jgi:hypothetical protein
MIQYAKFLLSLTDEHLINSPIEKPYQNTNFLIDTIQRTLKNNQNYIVPFYHFLNSKYY